MKKLRNIILLVFVVAMISAAFPALADSNCNASENYYTLGNEQYQTGNFQEAINSFTCVIERNTEDVAAYNLRGNAYRSIENFDLALADYNSAIEHDEEYSRRPPRCPRYTSRRSTRSCSRAACGWVRRC
jgi:tetratricopeptide (TPR) repeat protein